MSDRKANRSRVVRAAVLFLLSTVLVVASAAAQTLVPQKPAKAKRPLAAAVRMQVWGAKLTPEQQQQLRGIVQSHQAEIKALGEKAKALHQAKKAGGQIDPRDLQDLKARRQALVTALRQQTQTVLTPEQQKRVKMLRKRLIRRLRLGR